MGMKAPDAPSFWLRGRWQNQTSIKMWLRTSRASLGVPPRTSLRGNYLQAARAQETPSLTTSHGRLDRSPHWGHLLSRGDVNAARRGRRVGNLGGFKVGCSRADDAMERVLEVPDAFVSVALTSFCRQFKSRFCGEHAKCFHRRGHRFEISFVLPPLLLRLWLLRVPG